MKYLNSIIIFFVTIIISSCGIKDDYLQPSHSYWLKTHQFNVGQTTLMLSDITRKRPLKTEIWYPTFDTIKINISAEYPFKLPRTSKDAEIIKGTFPLILLSHGTGGNRISQMCLACELVGQGYIVASVDHYGNTFDNKIPENFVRIWDRPKDISFVLKQLLSDDFWRSKIDTAKIGMVGFSLGGYTALALAGGQISYNFLQDFSKTDEGIIEFTLPELGNISHLLTTSIANDGEKENINLKDNRIKAFIALAPAMGQGYKSKKQFENITSPIMIIGAQGDERTPVQTNANHYHLLIGESKYVELEGKVGHYIFMNVAKDELIRNAPIIFKDDISVNRKEVHKNVATIVLDFFEDALK
jgi:predicted dienelactone hydrolase